MNIFAENVDDERPTRAQAEDRERARKAVSAFRETMRLMTNDALWALIASEAQRRIDEDPSANNCRAIMRTGETLARIGWTALPPEDA